MATTTNFGWDTPDDTDYVTDGAAAMRELGQDIDTTLVDLKGGTTGQMLTKNSNTDMDFVWASPNPGDITGVTAGTGLTGGGTSGDVTLNFDVANYGGGQYAAGKNKVINGDFGIWQRGTTFSNPSSGSYHADRFFSQFDGTGATRTISQQTFTPGTAPVSGYESAYFLRYNVSVAGTGNTYTNIKQAIENVRTFAGQLVTFSVWLKADSARTVTLNLNQFFGSGGSSEVVGSGINVNVTTSWQRFAYTTTLGSISGKTIGSGSYLTAFLGLPSGTTQTIDIWGVQVEAGSIATAFQTATGTIQGELAACTYYFERLAAESASNGAATFAYGLAVSTTQVIAQLRGFARKRTTPSITFSGNTDFRVFDQVTATATTSVGGVAASVMDVQGFGIVSISAVVASGLTQYRPYFVIPAGGSGTRYIDISSEL